MNISTLPRTAAKPDGNGRSIDTRKRQRLAKSLTLAAMSLGYVVVQLDVTIVNVAINSIGASYGESLSDLQWIVNAYTITLRRLF